MTSRNFDQKLWTGVALALITAATIAYVVLRFWADWSALIVLAYAIYFLGGVLWIKHTGLLRSSVAVGMMLGLLAPLGYWLFIARL